MPRLYSGRDPKPAKGRFTRMMQCMIRQKTLTHLCPDVPRLDGQLALVTGGTGGIGAEITKGLAHRGADVIAASRGGKTEIPDCERWSQETGQNIEFLQLDLSENASIRSAVATLETRMNGRLLNLVIANAGIVPNAYGRTKDGFETAFGVNCLGHHILLRDLIEKALIADGGRVVGTTGDIYIFAHDCTSNYVYSGGGTTAYNRSKLGNLWQFKEMARRFDSFETISVHPGVVASGLMGQQIGIRKVVADRLMISPTLGAQASLIAATQTDIQNGDYFHNTVGIRQLSENDPAMDAGKASAFWDMLEAQFTG